MASVIHPGLNVSALVFSHVPIIADTTSTVFSHTFPTTVHKLKYRIAINRDSSAVAINLGWVIYVRREGLGDSSPILNDGGDILRPEQNIIDYGYWNTDGTSDSTYTTIYSGEVDFDNGLDLQPNDVINIVSAAASNTASARVIGGITTFYE